MDLPHKFWRKYGIHSDRKWIDEFPRWQKESLYIHVNI